MRTFIALYRGSTVASAELIAVTADSQLIAQVAGRLLERQSDSEDPVVTKLECGRRGALRAVRREARAIPFRVAPGPESQGGSK